MLRTIYLGHEDGKVLVNSKEKTTTALPDIADFCSPGVALPCGIPFWVSGTDSRSTVDVVEACRGGWTEFVPVI